MFVDTAKVFVGAGKGGDGAVSFRHEIYVDKGGPDGGDGGKGGDVVFLASENVNTLLDFRYKPELKAQPGGNGSKSNRRGRSGEDLIVKVPVGTLVKRDGRVIADLVENNQRAVVAMGGDGGFGNAHFKSSVRQTPRIRELGEPGDIFEADLELKLLADVGLIGFPNAGKSTFLSVVSNARPEIADYAFTTLTPNLGVADFDGSSLLLADIPGLIEGASEGKGLGDAFLRHVERTAVLLHFIDIYSDDIADKYGTIRTELRQYSSELIDRPEIIALTKAEGLDDEIVAMQRDAVMKASGASEVYVISSAARSGLKEVLRAVRAQVDQVRSREREELNVLDEPDDVISLTGDALFEAWSVESDAASEYRIIGPKIEKFAQRTDFTNIHSVNRLRDIMQKMGIMHELTRKGVKGDSIVRIGHHELTVTEQ